MPPATLYPLMLLFLSACDYASLRVASDAVAAANFISASDAIDSVAAADVFSAREATDAIAAALFPLRANSRAAGALKMRLLGFIFLLLRRTM